MEGMIHKECGWCSPCMEVLMQIIWDLKDHCNKYKSIYAFNVYNFTNGSAQQLFVKLSFLKSHVLIFPRIFFFLI